MTGMGSASGRRGLGMTASQLAGAVALALLVPWWLALASWARGVSGYLGVPGVGTSGFAWITLITATGVIVVAGLPSHVPSVRVRTLLSAAFVLLVAALAIPNLLAGWADGISTVGLLVAVISVAQALLISMAIRYCPHR